MHPVRSELQSREIQQNLRYICLVRTEKAKKFIETEYKQDKKSFPVSHMDSSYFLTSLQNYC